MRQLLILVALLFLLSCFEKKSKHDKAKITSESFEISREQPSTLGVNDSILNDLTQKIKQHYYPNIHSVLIAKDGNLIYENYFKGEDQNFGGNLGIRQFSDTTLHDIRSVTKSVVSALVGICIHKELIKDVNEPISKFFPEYTFEGKKKKWTLNHFLTMTTGQDWNEDVPYDDPKNDEIKMTYSNNPVNYVFNKDILYEPGSKWNYSGGTTQVLAEIVERVSNKSIKQFASDHLFSPLNIKKFEWNKYSKWGGADTYAAASGLRLTSRALLKIGLLYRNKGQWQGNQIFSKKWVEASFSRHIGFPCSIPDCMTYYGYQFWLWSDSILGKNINLVSAIGNGDQKIYWDFENDVIIVINAGNYNKWDFIKNNSETMYKQHIYPAIFNNE